MSALRGVAVLLVAAGWLLGWPPVVVAVVSLAAVAVFVTALVLAARGR